MSLTEEEDVLSCSIRDDGAGFDVEPMSERRDGHLGLRLMQDRLEAVGATLVMASAPGLGTELSASIPAEV